MRDAWLAVRSLRRSIGFSSAAVAAVALGVAAATAVFSVSDRMLFRPLPYVDPDRLVAVAGAIKARGLTDWAVTGDEFDAWRASNRTLADLAGYQAAGNYTLALPDAPVEVAVHRITVNFLDLLGVAPAMGRPFNASDFAPGAPPVLLLSDRTWRRLFAANPAAVGQFIIVNGTATEVAGVLPAGFIFPVSSAYPVPEAVVPLVRTSGSSPWRQMIGRLGATATVADAHAEIDAIAAARKGETGLRDTRLDGATVTPLHETLAEDSRTILLLLLGAVSALVLLGCANVANLLLARGADREGELAVRRSLGASRSSIVRLLLTESLAIALVGGVLGAVLAYIAVGIVAPLIPQSLQKLGDVAVDGRALAFALCASVSVSIVAGIGPALASARADVLPSLALASGRSTETRWRLRQFLVASEVAIAVVLLVAAGLMVNTMSRLLATDVGYTTESTLTMRVQLPRGAKFPPRSKAFVDSVLRAAGSVGGVTNAGVSEGEPIANMLYAGHYRVEGFPAEWMRLGVDPGGGPCCTQTQWVSADYFAAAGISIVQGRGFTLIDAAAAPPVAVISERLARKFPPELSPVGHSLTAWSDAPTDRPDRRLIVGVARDVRDMAVERTPLPTIYLPLEERGASALTLVVRTTSEPRAIAGPLERAVQSQAGPVIITDVLTLNEIVTRSIAPRELNAWLFGSFGLLAFLLAVMGVGSVVSYSVSKRTREMGVRMALGAQPSDVQWLVVRESMPAIVAGLTIGVGAASWLSQYVASLLFGIEPRDPWTYLAASVPLAVAAILAALLPARTAALTEPLTALRTE